MIKIMVMLAAALAFATPLPSRAPGPTISTEQEACDRVMVALHDLHHVPRGIMGSCDFVPGDPHEEEYFVLRLNSTRVCEYICSNLMGWFAVQKATGRVFEYDVGEVQVGEPIVTTPAAEAP